MCVQKQTLCQERVHSVGCHVIGVILALTILHFGMKLFVYGFLPASRGTGMSHSLCVLSIQLCMWQMLKNIASQMALNGMAAAPGLIPEASKSRE